jgi:integrase
MVRWNHQGLIGIKHDGRDVILLDPKGHRLALKVTKSGKSWIWRARVAGVPRVITLGRFPSLGLADARAKARAIVADLYKGKDVYSLHGVGGKVVRAPLPTTLTCPQAWDRYISGLESGVNVHGKAENKPSTISFKKGAWRRRLQDQIGNYLITEVSDDMLLDIVQNIRDEGEMASANATTAYLKAFFKWAKAERRTTGLRSNPAEDLTVSAARKRERFLDAKEIRWLWMALNQQSSSWADAYRLALLTGQRRNEIFGLTRAEVNQVDRHLDFPRDRMKNGRPHIVPLGDQAWAVVERRLSQVTSLHLFPTAREDDTSRHMSGFSKAQKCIREAVSAIAKMEQCSVPHWTFHDLRRTFSTHANGIRDDQGNRLIAKDHIERVMSHVIGGVEGIYDRNDYYVEKRRALRLWEDRLLQIIGRF